MVRILIALIIIIIQKNFLISPIKHPWAPPQRQRRDPRLPPLPENAVTLISAFPILHFPLQKIEAKTIKKIRLLLPRSHPLPPRTLSSLLLSSPLLSSQKDPIFLSCQSGCAGNEMNLSSHFGSLGE